MALHMVAAMAAKHHAGNGGGGGAGNGDINRIRKTARGVVVPSALAEPLVATRGHASARHIPGHTAVRTRN